MRLFWLGLLAVVLTGCATREVGTVRPRAGVETPTKDPPSDQVCEGGKVVWVTIDGTSNTPVSRTAAARLHELVEAYTYTPGHALAVWYAEGVGSAGHDILGKAVGLGVNEDVKKAYAFLTKAWRPCDRLFLNGFSRGAYSVRALGGLLYMAGIPDLGALTPRERNAIVDDLFDAYKTRTAYPGKDGLNLRRRQRIEAVYAKHGLTNLDPRRQSGFTHPETSVTVEAMTIWDTVQAVGLPDGSEDPTEGPAHFLITACNAKAVFQALALDDNRAYSFTPVLAGGPEATSDCPPASKRQNINAAVEEVWFSGAHADVGGTYAAGPMLDGELASVSLNWMIGRLRSETCRDCGAELALPQKILIPENRLTAVHDGKETSFAYRKLFRQSRKPLTYWYRAYGPAVPARVHASVFDRLEWLFALDVVTDGCNGSRAPGKPVLCAEEIAALGLVPELMKRGCLETGDWGYRLKQGQACVEVVGERVEWRQPAGLTCRDTGVDRRIEAMVYASDEAAADARFAKRRFVMGQGFEFPYPRCARGEPKF